VKHHETDQDSSSVAN